MKVKLTVDFRKVYLPFAGYRGLFACTSRHDKRHCLLQVDNNKEQGWGLLYF